MTGLYACASLAVTLSVALARPRLGSLRLGPGIAALAGVALLLAAGAVHPADVMAAAGILWRPLCAILAIMVMAAVVEELGTLSRIAAALDRGQSRSAPAALIATFLACAATAVVLNNDAAVLLLTPLVVEQVRRRWPGRPQLVEPFAFAVFLAPGVAPLVVSNPMNMIVAGAAGIGFNGYARRMLAVWLAVGFTSLLLLSLAYARRLREAGPPRATPAAIVPARRGERAVIALLLLVLVAYPVVGYHHGPIWAVAAVAAALQLLLAWRAGSAPRVVLRHVSWETLIFLFGAFVLGVGLQNAGLVGRLTEFYRGAGPSKTGLVVSIGGVSAVGSALLNNHPMAILNMLAIQGLPRGLHGRLLAALIGGDLGPRLLPIGSLAGLLWLESLRRLGHEVPLRRFVLVGLLTALVPLVLGLVVLGLEVR